MLILAVQHKYVCVNVGKDSTRNLVTAAGKGLSDGRGRTLLYPLNRLGSLLHSVVPGKLLGLDANLDVRWGTEQQKIAEFKK